LKIRHDALALSSILFTVALLMLAPSMFALAGTTHQARFRDIATGADASAVGDQIAIPNYYAPLGFASLTIIAVGLVVTWTGYIKGIRWTYFVMFVIVWLWVFPVLMLPFFFVWRAMVSWVQTLGPYDWIRLIKDAISKNGIERDILESFVALLLMLLAIVLPVKTFIGGRGDAQAGPGARI